jgi:hypothetical protein
MDGEDEGSGLHTKKSI